MSRELQALREVGISTDRKVSESQRRLVMGLSDALGPTIMRALEDPDVIEVMLNSDGCVFIERLGQGISPAGAMRASDAEIVIAKVAHALKTEAGPLTPIVSGELPLGGHRFEGLLPPAASHPVFAIRKRASTLFRLDQYVADGVMSAGQMAVIRSAISSHWNIVVAGGTGSGKTTLTNAILAELSELFPDDRLLILEDTAEICCKAQNHVILHTSDGVDMQRLLKSTMRLRPDRIIVGEVRDGAALTLIKAWNTGHPGGVTTIHANSAAAALTRLEQLVAEVSTQPIPAVIAEAVDLVIFIRKTSKGRRIEQILRVVGLREGRYVTTSVDGQIKQITEESALNVAIL